MSLKRAKRSAGILAYRRLEGALQVLLVHPGGPYWAHKDEGVWSIPKGEYAPEEEPLQAAQREFHEETGFTLQGPFEPLAPCRQGSGKWVEAWAVQAPELDPKRLHSNRFTIVGTRYAGTYPEVDRAEWFTAQEAERKLLSGQLPLLRELAARLEATKG